MEITSFILNYDLSKEQKERIISEIKKILEEQGSCSRVVQYTSDNVMRHTPYESSLDICIKDDFFGKFGGVMGI